MKDYISIIIAYHEGKAPKTLRIKKAHLKIALLFLGLLAVISFGSHLLNLKLISERSSVANKEKKLEEEKSKIYTEREMLAKEIERLEKEKRELIERLEKEKRELKHKIARIEKNIALIEEYLAERGAIKRPLGVGGASYKVNLEDLSYLNLLEKRSDYLLSTIRSIPMGYPVYGRITSHLGWRKNPFGRGYEFHSGIDIEAPYGSKVVATADGVVEMAGHYGDYGKTVIIKHPSGYTTLYAHLSEILVKVGQKVKAGEVIGKVGSTGRSTGPHLHYEVQYGGKLKNPIEYLTWR
ncbi:MAG: peptidoglycan DD-metalloendopeptidase family protein [Aquificaceae bacterium]